MNLYERDYTILTPEEEAQWRTVEAAHTKTWGECEVKCGSIRDYPKAARHFVQLFPNNYLDIVDLEDTERLLGQLSDFERLLDSGPAGPMEQGVLAFIRHNCAYFIVGSILSHHYDFGHHGAFLFPEFPLGTSYQADYLIVGKGSGGWEFVFVEFEAPTPGSILQNGELGAPFRTGLKQVADWDQWLEAHYVSLREVFDKYKRVGESLPAEFVNLDKSRLHFVVVAGRRSGFKQRTYRLRRQGMDRALLLHYDNLIEYAKGVIGRATY